MQNIVVIGGSAGSINALKTILRGLPEDFPAAVLVVTHIGPRESILPSLLERCSRLPVRHALQGEPIVPGQVLVAPPDVHLTVAMDGDRAYAALSHGPRENHSRPAIDPLFRSAAWTYGTAAIGVVLSGFLDDGTVGLQAIKACGGVAVVQDPQEADAPDMPASAVQYAAVDIVCPVDQIAPTLIKLVSREDVAVNELASAGQRERLDRIGIEHRAFNQGVEMQEMDKIGSRAALTCPECGGALWEVEGGRPQRYRCHTGHAMTARVLEGLQGGAVEEALWAAVRALHEQEGLYRDLHRSAPPYRQGAVDEYLDKAEKTHDQAQLLRDLITTRARLAAR